MKRSSHLGWIGALALQMTIASSASATLTAQFAPSRTSGVAPLAVFFDATTTVSSATPNPFHEVTYSWDFGDPSSGSWPSYEGMPVRAKNLGFGPVAAHVFDTPGSYTVRLSVQDGLGGVSSSTAVITVTDPNTVFSGTNTICIANSGQSFTGCPAGAAQVITNAWSTVRSNVTAGKRVLLCRGGTYTSSGTQTFSGGSVGILGAFGSGAKPIVNSSSGTPIQLGSGMKDWRLMDLDINATGSPSTVVSNQSNMTQFLFYRLDVDGGTGANIGYALDLDSAGGTFHDQDFYVEGTSRNSVYPWYGGGHRIAIMGTEMDHAGQHVIRMTHQDLVVLSGNYLHDSGGNQHLLKFHGEGWDSGSSGKLGYHTYSGRAVISDNVLGEHSSSIYVAIGAQNNVEDERVRDVIIERNFFRNSAFASTLRVESTFTTVRNNIFHMESTDSYGIEINKQQGGIEGTNTPSETIPRSIWVYNNSGYSTTACSGCNMGFVVDKIGSPNSVARNNLLYTPNSTSTVLAVGLGGWTTSNNVKATSNPFVSSAPSIQNPLNFSIATGNSIASAGANVQSNLLDFKAAPRSSTAIAVGAVDAGGGSTSTSLPPPVLLSVTPN